MTSAAVREGRVADAAAINEIYNPYIRDSVATFETEPYTLEQRAAWIAEKRGARRLFVAEAAAGGLAGFANSSAFDPRGAYSTSVKVSVFLAPEAKGRGLGRALYAALFDALSGEDVHRAYALVVTPNPASEGLHAHFGFRRLATLSEVGRKFGRYRDVTWFEKAL